MRLIVPRVCIPEYFYPIISKVRLYPLTMFIKMARLTSLSSLIHAQDLDQRARHSTAGAHNIDLSAVHIKLRTLAFAILDPFRVNVLDAEEIFAGRSSCGKSDVPLSIPCQRSPSCYPSLLCFESIMVGGNRKVTYATSRIRAPDIHHIVFLPYGTLRCAPRNRCNLEPVAVPGIRIQVISLRLG